VVARRQCKNVPYTSQQKIAQDKAIGSYSIRSQRSSKLFGTRQPGNSSIKAGVDIVRKSVVHIDNLDANCTVGLLSDYLFANDIAVLNCYATKSWLCIDEKHRFTACRVNVGRLRIQVYGRMVL